MKNPHEAGPERIPTKEEIEAKIKELIAEIAGVEIVLIEDEVEGKNTIVKSDEQGPYFLEVTVPGERELEKTEYTYMRGSDPSFATARLSTGIDIAYYDENGEPCQGPKANLAEFIDGQWVKIEG